MGSSIVSSRETRCADVKLDCYFRVRNKGDEFLNSIIRGHVLKICKIIISSENLEIEKLLFGYFSPVKY
jgi:hypothetical protein